MLLGARGLGAGLGPIIGSRLVRGDVGRVLRVCGIAGIAFSICYLATPWSGSIIVTAGLVALAHLGGGSQWTLSTYGLQLRTPDHIRGRVMAGDFAIVTLVMSITGLLAGVVSQQFDVQTTITAFALAAFVAGLVYLRAVQPIIRGLAAASSSDPA